MKLLKTFTSSSQWYLECEYKNNYATYWFKEQKLDTWNICIPEDFRTYISIGYVYENT